MSKANRLQALAAASAMLALAALAQTSGKAPEPPKPEPGKSAEAKAAEAKAGTIQYQAPEKKGAPRGRIGGGTRGDARELVMAVIAPDHTGWSSTAQPEFFWYSSQPVSAGPEFTILEDEAIDPIVESRLPPPAAAGFQRVSLKSFGKQLAPGKEYRWFVTLVTDKASRSKDVVASGRIAFMPLSPELSARVAKLSRTDRTAVLARSGYWYDVISDLEAAGASKANVGLYESAGLHEVARYLKSVP